MLKKANGYIRINDLLQEEINFWSSYGVYLVREELKTELLETLFDYKSVLVKIFTTYSSYDVTLEEDELEHFGLKGLNKKNEEVSQRASDSNTS